MPTLAERARAFATERHDGQVYGDGLPYTVHLEAVELVLAETGYRADYWVALAWLHDVLEDTPTTEADLISQFGNPIAEIVVAVSGFGQNRKERNADIAAKIKHSLIASTVKVADRIANLESPAPGSRHANMYLDERSQFFNALFYPMPLNLMDRLNAAFSRLSI